jgi:general secretion pathway protein G
MARGVRNDGGWTFLETLIAIVIVVTLTGTVGIVGSKLVSQARRIAARSQIESYKVALNAYAMDCGTVPTEAQGLAALWRKPVLEPVPHRWNGPYVSGEISTDPWGRPYVYSVPGPEGLAFSIVSFGADGRRGGQGSEADVVSWSHSR